MMRRVSVLVVVVALLANAAPASAEPEPVTPDPALATVAAAEVAPPVDDGKVASSPPSTTKAPDGTTLTISARDETQMPAAPLTTAISTREYVAGGVFNGSVKGSEETPEGVFEVGYQIGCGIDMSTSAGVLLSGSAGINPSITYFGFDFLGTLPDGLAPGIAGNLGGSVAVGLKPGIINIVPVTKKEYKGAEPWVSISNFRVKIDGCVGESFIRSYATLTHSPEQGEAILSWFGVTKAI
jgi:hypothetical protein